MIRELNNSHWTEEIQHTLILEEMVKTSRSMENVVSKVSQQVSEVPLTLIELSLFLRIRTNYFQKTEKGRNNVDFSLPRKSTKFSHN